MSAPNLRPGEIVDGRYMLRRRLGAGSCGVVWAAEDPERGAEVALKILHPQLASERALIEQLAREAALLKRMDHPNLARAFAFEDKGPLVYLAMELLAGHSLDQEIGQHTKAKTFFRQRTLARIVDQVCAGIEYAHARGIVHRDLKPQNVIVEPDGAQVRAKVLDFGIARLSEVSLFEATTLGRRLGSMFYMSPEQTRGEPADARSDVFALGSILFELLTLRRAWAWDEDGRPLPAFDAPVAHSSANSVAAVFTRLSGPHRPRPRAVRPELPPVFDAIVARALAVDPADRYPDVVAFARETRHALLVLTGMTPAVGALQADPDEMMSDASEAAATIAMDDEDLKDILPSGDSVITDRRAAPLSEETRAALEAAMGGPDPDAPRAKDGPFQLPRDPGAPAIVPTLALEGSTPAEMTPATPWAAAPALDLPSSEHEAATVAPEPAATQALLTDDIDDEGPPTAEVPAPTPAAKGSATPTAFLPMVVDEPIAARAASTAEASVASAPRIAPNDPTNFVPEAAGAAGFSDALSPAGPTSAEPAPDASDTGPVAQAALPKRLLIGVFAGGIGLFAGVLALVVQASSDDGMPPMAPMPMDVMPDDKMPAMDEGSSVEGSAPRHPELLSLLQKVRKNPEDEAAMDALVKGIWDAAADLPDAERTEIRQIATLSSTVRNIDGLASCVARLEAAE